MAASPCGSLVASACRSQEAESSKVLVWDTGAWTQVAALPGHTLTVTQVEIMRRMMMMMMISLPQLAWSPCSSLLVSVSRDRSWVLHSVTRSPDTGQVVTSTLATSERRSKVGTRAVTEPSRSVHSSSSKSSIRRFVIKEKAPTMAFSWLIVPTLALSHFRHYSLDIKTLCQTGVNPQ